MKFNTGWVAVAAFAMTMFSGAAEAGSLVTLKKIEQATVGTVFCGGDSCKVTYAVERDGVVVQSGTLFAQRALGSHLVNETMFLQLTTLYVKGDDQLVAFDNVDGDVVIDLNE